MNSILPPFGQWLSDEQIRELYDQSLLQIAREDAILSEKLASEPPGYFCSRRGLDPDSLCWSCRDQFICGHVREFQS